MMDLNDNLVHGGPSEPRVSLGEIPEREASDTCINAARSQAAQPIERDG